jgi:O-antigen ligase
VIGGATAAGIILIVQYAFLGLQSRLDDNVLADYRLAIAANTWKAIKAFQPFGSGFGTFENVYRIFESTDALIPAYVNQAHNDWLQLWLEGGWLGLALLVAFLIWFGRAAVRTWRAPPREGRALDRSLAQAGAIVVVLLLIHSAMDYPLRTTTMMAIFAFSLALLIPPPPSAQRHVRRRPSGSDTRPLHKEARGSRRRHKRPSVRRT